MFPPEATALLSQRTPAVFTTMLPDGSPHSVVVGVMLDGDELVTNTVPTAKRLTNLRADPRVTVIVIDPSSPMRYLEVRGTATIMEQSAEDVAKLLAHHAVERGDAPQEASSGQPAVAVLQVRVTPVKVNFYEFNPSQLGPEASARRRSGGSSGGPNAGPQEAGDGVALIPPDGVLRDDLDGRWIEFERAVDHSAEAVWAALTDPRRLVLWQHPVEFFPELREGATVYAHLNPQAKAFALGKVIECKPPHSLAFRWTTTHPMLSPDLTLSYLFEGGTLKVRYGPFSRQDAVIPMAASLHIHLDHLERAITTPEDELPSPPWPSVSVVTQSGQMRFAAEAYGDKYPLMRGPGPGGVHGAGRPPAA